jgi:3',5'-cyclic AMP phosphodiesterase CpdA
MIALVRETFPDDTLLVFLSDTHIGGPAGSDIFASAAELTSLLGDLDRHQGPVELVLAGDFLDLLRMGDAGRGQDLVADTVGRPEYQGLFAALRAFRQAAGHRVVYVVGNHDAEVWWNPGCGTGFGGGPVVASDASKRPGVGARHRGRIL